MKYLCLLICLLQAVSFARGGDIPPTPIPECVNKAVDIMFLIDGSNSLTVASFELEKQFVIDVVDKLDPATAYAGAIAFSRDVWLPIVELSPINAALKNELQGLGRQGSLTHTDKAIDAMVAELTARGRDGVCKVVVIVTDGRSTVPADTATAIKTAYWTHPNLHIIAIGVDDLVLQSELELMASGFGDENVFLCQNFEDLANEVGNIGKTACKICCDVIECGADKCGTSGAHKGQCLDEGCCWEAVAEECRVFPS